MGSSAQGPHTLLAAEGTDLSLQTVKQLNLFDADDIDREPTVETPAMSKEELSRWKDRIYRYQRTTRLGQVSRQQSLFEPPRTTRHEPNEIDPLRLKLHPADFYRMPPSLVECGEEQGCIYFLVDHFAELILYIGETKLSAYQRWMGTHYAKDYTLNYIELHRRYDLECAVCSAFWVHVPPEKKILLQWERELIFKWRPPFNRQMWESYGQPFKRF